MRWYLMVWKRAFDFAGRSRRKEFWMFSLIHLLIQAVLMIVAVALSMMGQADIGRILSIVAVGYWIVGIIPYVACFFRRLHDTGRSGWWWLFALVPIVGAIVDIVFLATNGAVGANKYGMDPKAA